ncbi:MAG: DUF5915 domain-containing protein [Nitrosomonadaceae bacterium]
MIESYLLYREGIVNEVIHLLQRRRRELKLQIMDKVNVAIVQEQPDNLTSSVYLFSDKIVERIRAMNFSPNPLPSVEPVTISFKHFKETFTFDVYMEKA